MPKRETSILAFPLGAVVCNLRVEPRAQKHPRSTVLGLPSPACLHPVLWKGPYITVSSGCRHLELLKSRAAGLGRGRGESRDLLALGQGCSQTATPHPILGSSQCLQELISEARKCTCAKPGCTVRFESLRCGPDALYFKTGSSPTRAITRSLR